MASGSLQSTEAALQGALRASMMREDRLIAHLEHERGERTSTVVTAFDTNSKQQARGDVSIRIVRNKRGQMLTILSVKVKDKNVRHGLTRRKLLDVAFSRLVEDRKLATAEGVAHTRSKRVRNVWLV